MTYIGIIALLLSKKWLHLPWAKKSDFTEYSQLLHKPNRTETTRISFKTVVTAMQISSAVKSVPPVKLSIGLFEFRSYIPLIDIEYKLLNNLSALQILKAYRWPGFPKQIISYSGNCVDYVNMRVFPN